jgi:hypothetical protein
MAHTLFNGRLILGELPFWFDEPLKCKIQGYVAAYNKEVAKAKHAMKFKKTLNRMKDPKSRIMWNRTNFYDGRSDYDYIFYHDIDTINHVIDIARTRIQREVMAGGGSSPYPNIWWGDYGCYWWLFINTAMKYIQVGGKKPRYVSGQGMFYKWIRGYIDRMWKIYQV